MTGQKEVGCFWEKGKEGFTHNQPLGNARMFPVDPPPALLRTTLRPVLPVLLVLCE